MNAVHLSGRVSEYGPKISWTETGKPQTSFMLVVEQAGKEGSTFKTFVPVLIVGAQAEPLATSLEPGTFIIVDGKLGYHAKPSPKAGEKSTGTIAIIAFNVEVVPRPSTTAEADLYGSPTAN